MRPITPVALVFVVAAIAMTSCDARTIAPPDVAQDTATTAAPDSAAEQAPTHTPTVTATPAPIMTVASIATSRGPNLEATDPEGVRLDAGDLQLVEFFRFT